MYCILSVLYIYGVAYQECQMVYGKYKSLVEQENEIFPVSWLNAKKLKSRNRCK